MAKESAKKWIKGILTGVWWAIVALLAVCIISILSAKMKGKVPKLFGYSVMQIVSGSMEEEIPQGSYILVKECDPEEIKEQDIICFYSDDPQIYGMPNTHRVMERVESEAGLRFITKGDANPIEDTVQARAERVIGVYVKKLTAISALSAFLEGKGTLVLLVVLQVATCFFAVYAIVNKKASEEEDANEPNEPKA